MHGYLCFVPRAAAPDDARWECSDDTPVEDPVLHHMKAGSHAAVFSIKTAFPITTNNHYNKFNLSFYSEFKGEFMGDDGLLDCQSLRGGFSAQPGRILAGLTPAGAGWPWHIYYLSIHPSFIHICVRVCILP